MKHLKHRLCCFAMSIVLVLSLSVPVLAEGSSMDATQSKQLIDAVIDHLILYGRYEDISEKSLYQSAIEKLIKENPDSYTLILKGMLESIDQYSEYYTPEESEDLMISVSGEIVGIGVTIDFSDPNTARIASVIPDTPAERAGIQVGDIILSANGVDLRGVKSEILLSHVRGEENTEVYVEVNRDGTTIGFTMIREKIVGTSITSEIYEQNGQKLMCICIYGFVSNTAEKFREALDTAEKNGITRLILDLRDNGGGIFEQAIAMAQNFVPKDKTITTADYKLKLLNHVYQGDAPASRKFDTVILLNEYSASASEVFAAALKENELATTIGLTSYGKGTIQSINSLTDGGMIKFTTGYYLTPLGNNIHGVGITPDVIIENSFTKPDKSQFGDFGYNKVYTIGDTHDDIRTAKEILQFYGLYQGEINDVFDKDLSYAVYAFQTQSKLYPYGVLDITTQIHIHNYLDIVEIEQDDQLKAAFEHFGMQYLQK